MQKIIRFQLPFLALLLCSCDVFTEADTTVKVSANYYVSPEGSTANLGTLSSPFGTLESARNVIRSMIADNTLPEGGVTVHLRGGNYNRAESFSLSADDSGTVDKPISYKAFQDEVPVLIGGRSLTNTNFSLTTDASIQSRLPTEAKGNVYEIDLTTEGITEYAGIKKIGFGWDKQSLPPILQIDGEDQTLARYPNDGFMTIESVVNMGSIPRNSDPKPWTGATFTYSDTRADRWVNAPDMWLFGYFFIDWADGNLQVSSLDTVAKTITTVGPSRYGVKEEQRFYAYNLLEEIDQPGEYYIDRKSNILYLYPKNGANITTSEIKLGLLETPIIAVDNAAYITFEGIHFDLTTGKGIAINDSDHILVKGNKFTNIGLWAVAIGNEEAAFEFTKFVDSESGGGRYNGVVDNLMYDLYAGGISIMGGNRTTLEPANNYAENNHIFKFARFYRTYNPAISLNGVGNRAVHNLIHDAPHQAIQFRGNDLLMEKNEIHHVLTETNDSGAIYSLRDWTFQGNVIKHNYIHSFTNDYTFALYFDDLMSGIEVVGNVIEGVIDSVIMSGGGRGHLVHNNIFIDSKNTGRYDDRGMNWAKACTTNPTGECYINLMNVPYKSKIWAERYPLLTNILDDESTKPKNLTIKNNVLLRTEDAELADEVIADALDISKNIHYANDPGFVDAANKNWQLKANSKVYTDIPEFQAIPFNEIGLAHPTHFRLQIEQ